MKMRTLITVLGSVLALNCEGSGSSGGVGEIHLALSLPNGMSISSVNWQVLSSMGMTIIQGTINTSDPNLPPSVITGIPTGVNDTVSMSAMTNTGVACSGTSMAFNVVAGQAVNVPVNITCGSTMAGSGLGSAVITATVVAGDACPVVTAYSLSPASATSPSGQIAVSVAGNDPDMGDTISFAWSATAGTFASASSASTTYTCTTAGMQTLTVAITDDHTPTPCTTTITFPAVNCL